MTQGFKNIAQRIVNAEGNFVETVQAISGCSIAEAVKVLNVYKKHKVVKLDAVGARYTVKHGAFLDLDVISRAING